MNSTKTPKYIFDWLKEVGVRIVDFRFMYFPGLFLHFSISVIELYADAFFTGLNFNGSSTRGWQTTSESDMLVKPVLETVITDPFLAYKTIDSFCNIYNPISAEDYTRDQGNGIRDG